MTGSVCLSRRRGLEGKEAALDIRDLRSLVECIRLVRRMAVQTSVRMISTGVKHDRSFGSRFATGTMPSLSELSIIGAFLIDLNRIVD